MDIQTYDHGPFPGYPALERTRWTAIDADDYDDADDYHEFGGRRIVGYGATEAEAIHDLQCQLIEEGP